MDCAVLPFKENKVFHICIQKLFFATPTHPSVSLIAPFEGRKKERDKENPLKQNGTFERAIEGERKEDFHFGPGRIYSAY